MVGRTTASSPRRGGRRQRAATNPVCPPSSDDPASPCHITSIVWHGGSSFSVTLICFSYRVRLTQVGCDLGSRARMPAGTSRTPGKPGLATLANAAWAAHENESVWDGVELRHRQSRVHRFGDGFQFETTPVRAARKLWSVGVRWRTSEGRAARPRGGWSTEPPTAPSSSTPPRRGRCPSTVGSAPVWNVMPGQRTSGLFGRRPATRPAIQLGGKPRPTR